MFEQTLREIAGNAETAATRPDFADLLHRSRVRRRRRRATAGAVAMAVGAVIVVMAVKVSDLPSTSGPAHGGPAHTAQPTTAHRDTPTAQPPKRGFLLSHPIALVHQPDAHVSRMSYADPDHAAALWEVCSATDLTGVCPEVLTWTHDGWGTSRAMVIPDKLNVYALPDGSVVVWLYGNHSFLVAPDGTTRKITLARQPIAATPGGPLVNLPSINGARPPGMLNVKTATAYPPLTSHPTHCVYDDQWDGAGRIWEYGTAKCGPGHPTVAVSSDLGRTWSTHATAKYPILGIAVTPARTAVLLGGLGKAERQVLSGLDITTDGGRTWRHVSFPRTTVIAPPTIATTPQGGLLVGDGISLWRANGPWTALHQIHRPGWLTNTDFGFTAGRDVICAYGGSSSKVAVTTDGGQTWRTVTPRP